MLAPTLLLVQQVTLSECQSHRRDTAVAWRVFQNRILAWEFLPCDYELTVLWGATMTNDAIPYFDSAKKSRYGHRHLLSAVGMCAIAMSSVPVASAQTTADQEDNRAVNDFFRVMTNRISEGSSAETVPVVNGRASVGYYRVHVTAALSPPPTAQTKGCKAAIGTVGNNALLDVIFARRYDMGLAVSLPLALMVAGTTDAPESRAEVNLFRLTQTGGKRCGFSLSYFEKEGDYAGPWIPIDHRATALPQEAVIKFRPWVSRENNQARVSAFWDGLGGFVNLIGGPLPALGVALFGGGKDKYEIKGQANASIFNFTQDIKSTDAPQATRRIVVNPTSGSSFTPKAYSFNWALSGNDGEPFSYKLGYTIDIQYWASRLFPRDSDKQFPNLSKYDYQEFGRLLGDHVAPGGLAWNAIGPAVATLSEPSQDTPEKFDIACKPAFAELATLGFSREDQVLIVYGTAVAKRFTETQRRAIHCLFDTANAAEVTDKLAKFQIPAPVNANPTILPKTEPKNWYDALAASVTAFNAPSVIGAPASNFRRYLDTQVRIGGDTRSIVNSAGSPVFGDGATPYSLSSADFLKAFATARPMTAGCYSPRKSSAGTPIDFAFPEGSGMAPSADRSLAFLAEHDGKVFMVAIGIAGLSADHNPVIDQIWFGSALDPSDDGFHRVVTDMQMSTDSSCETRPSFKAFLAGLK